MASDQKWADTPSPPCESPSSCRFASHARYRRERSSAVHACTIKHKSFVFPPQPFFSLSLCRARRVSSEHVVLARFSPTVYAHARLPTVPSDVSWRGVMRVVIILGNLYLSKPLRYLVVNFSHHFRLKIKMLFPKLFKHSTRSISIYDQRLIETTTIW